MGYILVQRPLEERSESYPKTSVQRILLKINFLLSNFGLKLGMFFYGVVRNGVIHFLNIKRDVKNRFSSFILCVILTKLKTITLF